MRINNLIARVLEASKSERWTFVCGLAAVVLMSSSVSSEKPNKRTTAKGLTSDVIERVAPLQRQRLDMKLDGPNGFRAVGDKENRRLNGKKNPHTPDAVEVDVYRVTQGFERDFLANLDYDLIAGKDTLVRAQLYTTGSEFEVARSSCSVEHAGRRRYYPATGIPASRLNNNSAGMFNGGTVFECWLAGAELSDPGEYAFDIEIVMPGGTTSYTVSLGRKRFLPTGDLRLLVSGWVYPPVDSMRVTWNERFTANVNEAMQEVQRRYPLRAGVGQFNLYGDQPNEAGLRFYFNPIIYDCTLEAETVDEALTRCDLYLRAGADFVMRFFNAVFDSRSARGLPARDRFDLAALLGATNMGWYGQGCHGSQRSMGAQFDDNPSGSSVTVLAHELAHCMGLVSGGSPHSDGNSHSNSPWFIPGDPPPVNMRTHLPLMPVSMMNDSSGNVPDTILEGYEWNEMRGIFISRSGLLANAGATMSTLASNDRFQAVQLVQNTLPDQDVESFGFIALIDKSGQIWIDYSGRVGRMAPSQVETKQDTSPYALIFFDGTGKELSRVYVHPSFDSTHGQLDISTVSLMTPFPPNTERVEFQKDKQVLYSRPCSSGEPVCPNLVASFDSGRPVIQDLNVWPDNSGNLAVRWKASHPDKVGLHSLVLFKRSRGQPGIPISIGQNRGTIVFPTAFAPATSDARFTVQLSDGCNVATATTNSVRIGPKPPVVAISWPRPGLSFVAGQPIALVGSAFDYTEGPLGKQNFSWQVDGRTVSDPFALRLTPGTHRITFRAVAASGLSATSSLRVVALADTDGDGVQDVYEALHNCMSVSVFDSNQDPDGDGIASRGEFMLGTDPCRK